VRAPLTGEAIGGGEALRGRVTSNRVASSRVASSRVASSRVASACLLAACLLAAGAGAAGAAVPADRSARPATAAAGTPSLGSRGLVVGAREPALPSGIDAKGWLLADLDTGGVLAARDAHGRFLPASTIKILTALVTLTTLPPSRSVTITDHDASVEGTRVGLVPGMRYSVRELATAMLIASGNDAATALAQAAGGQAATVAAMNARARALGADDTHAVDPTGLDAPGQVTSAYDLAVLARAALAAPAIGPYLTLPRAKVRGRGGALFEIQNHNDLLGNYPGVLGVKNGYTVAADATYAGAARRDGHTLVVTLLSTRPDYAPEARALLDWGFAHLAVARPVGWLAKPAPPRPRALAPVTATASPHHSGRHTAMLTWLAGALTAAAAAVTWLVRARLRADRRLPPLPPAPRVGAGATRSTTVRVVLAQGDGAAADLAADASAGSPAAVPDGGTSSA
jgi:D-alanyl-D-alanine carboxypeptidase (penicillin-binding protein 5/6)